MRLVRALRAELGTEHGMVQRVARQLGYGTESVRLWVRQADIDDDRGELGARAPLHRAAGGAEHVLRRQGPPALRAGPPGAVLAPRLRVLWEEDYRVYGAWKLWRAVQRADVDVGRDRVARLMRAWGIAGARCTKRVRTTGADPGAARHRGLVRRDFTATAPNQLWVTDLTCVPTRTEVAYVCFIVDAYSPTIVGWRVAGHAERG